jgi:GNAT superfamily N-acetyltransferase
VTAHPAGLVRLDTHAQALRASGDSPFVRYDVPEAMDSAGWERGAAVALTRRTHTRRKGLLVMGPPDDAGALVGALVQVRGLPGDLRGVTVARDSFEAVEAHLPSGERSDWEWMCTSTPPEPVALEEELTALSTADLPAITALLELANPGTDARPFQHPGQTWVGVRDGDRLVACGVEEPGVSGWPVLSGITVHPDARGQGLGLAVTARLTRQAVRRTGVCTLGMYSHNAVARRVYLGLGYGDVHEWSSRRLPVDACSAAAAGPAPRG